MNMTDHCFICLENTPPLEPTCAPDTCHNLKAHPICLANMPHRQCAICKRHYTIQGDPQDPPDPQDPQDPQDPPDPPGYPWTPRSIMYLMLAAIWLFVALSVSIGFVAIVVFIRDLSQERIAVICCFMFAVVLFSYIQFRANLSFAHAVRTTTDPV